MKGILSVERKKKHDDLFPPKNLERSKIKSEAEKGEVLKLRYLL